MKPRFRRIGNTAGVLLEPASAEARGGPWQPAAGRSPARCRPRRENAMKANHSVRISVLTAVWVAVLTADATAESLRRVLSLDGTWQIAEGKMDAMPADFSRHRPRARFGGHGHARVRGTRPGGGQARCDPAEGSAPGCLLVSADLHGRRADSGDGDVEGRQGDVWHARLPERPVAGRPCARAGHRGSSTRRRR